MLIGIISDDTIERNADRALVTLDNKLEELIQTSQCFLFHAAVPFKDPLHEPLGCKWAGRRGCPLKFMEIKKILAAADYVLFVIDRESKDQTIKQAFMQYRMKYPEKHGSVIKI